MNSTVLWWGKTPTRWMRRRFKETFREREERSATGDETLLSVSAYTGVIPRSDIVEEGDYLTRAETLQGYKVCYPNDLVMNIMLAWNRGLGFSKEKGIVSPAYAVFELSDDSHPKFLNYLLRSDEAIRYFKAYSTGVIDSRLRLYPETFGQLHFFCPPLDEQVSIAAFLDRETGKIDALVEEQKRLIELLKEKRQAVISHAVTKGLNPNVRMKDSGVEWLGEVPEHWEVKALKYISPTITVGIVVNPSAYVSEEGLPFIYGGDIAEGRINSQKARRISELDSSENAKTILERGDLVTVRVGAPGVTAVVPEDCRGGNCASVMLIRKGAYCSEWLCYAMNSRIVRYQVEVVQYGAAQEQFNIAHAVNFLVPTPPESEQREIADLLAERIGKLNDLVETCEATIELLQERRSALISAAVTGKIDVRETIKADEAAA